MTARGGDVDGVIFHSDRGSEYTSTLVADYCAGQGIRRSMGRVGSCYDNAAAESFFATYKRETITTLETGRFADEAEARRETFRWIAFYNHRRRHSRAGQLAPIAYEQRHHRNSKLPDNSATVQSLAAWNPVSTSRGSPQRDDDHNVCADSAAVLKRSPSTD